MAQEITPFGIVGGGWRAEFYLRVAHSLPERFAVAGVVVRDPAKAQAFAERWGCPTFGTPEDLLRAGRPAFVVTSVPWAANAGLIRDLVAAGVPVLSETPPAPHLDDLLALHADVQRAGGCVQVAEQYSFQPLHAARLRVAASGALGTVSQAQVSAAHGYHGISLLRRFLGVTFEECTISGYAFASPIVAGPGRGGPPAEERVQSSRQTIARFDFGDRLGVFDFTGDQYFSWIRSPRVLLRGQRGEINDTTLRSLLDYRTPVEMELRRVNAGENGNLEGYYLKGILAGDEWVYRNPFAPARLSDDEIAVAACLDGMARCAAGGPEFYSLAEALQDRYLDIVMEQAIASGQPVQATRQPWATWDSDLP